MRVTGNLADKTLTTGDSLVRDTASGASGLAKDTVSGATGLAKETVSGASGLAKETVSGATGLAKETVSGASSLLRDFGSGVKDVLTMDRKQNNSGNKQAIPQQRSTTGNGTMPMALGTNTQYSGASSVRQSVVESKANYMPITADFSAFGR